MLYSCTAPIKITNLSTNFRYYCRDNADSMYLKIFCPSLSYIFMCCSTVIDFVLMPCSSYSRVNLSSVFLFVSVYVCHVETNTDFLC